MLYELQHRDFNLDFFKRNLDNIFILNLDDLHLGSEGLSMTGVKTLLQSKCLERNSGSIEDAFPLCNEIRDLRDRKDYEMIKLLLTLWKRDLPSDFVLDPHFFIHDQWTIEESISDVIRDVATSENKDFSMIQFLRDLFNTSLNVLDQYIAVEGINKNNICLLEFIEKSLPFEYRKAEFLRLTELKYWARSILAFPKEAGTFLLERFTSINDDEMSFLLQLLVSKNGDTDVFTKLLQIYGVEKTTDYFSCEDLIYMAVDDDVNLVNYISVLREEQRN